MPQFAHIQIFALTVFGEQTTGLLSLFPLSFMCLSVCEDACTCVVQILGMVNRSCWIREITAVGSLLIGVTEMELKYSGRAASFLNL